MSKEFRFYTNTVDFYATAEGDKITHVKTEDSVCVIPAGKVWVEYGKLYCMGLPPEQCHSWTRDVDDTLFKGIPHYERVTLTIDQMDKLDIPVEPLDYIPFYESDLGNDYLDFSNKEKLKAVTCKKIWDTYHQSDEVSTFMLIYLNGLLVAAYSKEGDHSDYDLYFFNGGKNLLRLHFLVEDQDSSLDTEIECFGNYIKWSFSRDGKYYYSISDTEWMCGFGQRNEVFHYFIDDNLANDPIQVELVKKVGGKSQSVEYLVRSVTDGQEYTVLANKLLYYIS
jgi:hypothetical protein